MSAIVEKAVSDLQPRLLNVQQYVGETTLTVKAEDIVWVCQTLKEKYGFNYLVDIFSIDHYRDEQRFEVNYNIMNLEAKIRLRVKTFVEEDQPELDSVVSVWPAANWNERETYDMMGIKFRHHPDLRRMFMPEDFEYFPLRKEFPLIGIPGSIQMPEKDPPKPYK
jgi:NADH-quinone oxidoreductase subunit C